jgi:hypothetical protein
MRALAATRRAVRMISAGSTVVLPTPPVETRSRQITPFVALRQRTTRDSRTSEAR